MWNFLVVLYFVAVASAQQSAPYAQSYGYLPIPRKAIVTIAGNGTSVKGSVTFTETSDGIQVTGSISGLSKGKHGFHVHVTGDLTNGCLSTGGHFNPTNVSHAARDATERHVGDLGNIEANASGIAEFSFVDKVISLSGDNNILGRGVVVHEDEDDLGLGGAADSKTTGHAGARIGCGVIGTLNETNSGTVAGVSTMLTMVIIAALYYMF